MTMNSSPSTLTCCKQSRRKTMLCPLLLLLVVTESAARGSLGVKGSYDRTRRLPVGNIFYVDEVESPSDKYGKAGKGKGFGKDKKKASHLFSHGKGKAGDKAGGGHFGFGKVGDWLGYGKGKAGEKGPKYGFNPDGSKCIYREYASSFTGGPPKLEKTTAPIAPTVSPAPTVTASPTKSPKVNVFVDGVNDPVKKTKAPSPPTYSPAPATTTSPTKPPKVNPLSDGVDPPDKVNAPARPVPPKAKPLDDSPKDKVIYPYCKETYPSPSSPTGGGKNPTGGKGGHGPYPGDSEPTYPTPSYPSSPTTPSIPGSGTESGPNTPTAPSTPTVPGSPTITEGTTDGSPTESSPTDGSPTGSPPTDGSPTGSSPTDGSPTGSSPTDGSPTGSSPTDSNPTEGTPTDGSPSTPNTESGNSTSYEVDCAAIAAGTAPTTSPVVQYYIDFEMSLTGDEDDVIARFEEFLRQTIAPLLAGCRLRRRLEDAEAKINNVVFTVEKDTSAEPFCNTCTSLDVITNIYYSEGTGVSGFRDLLYNTIIANCDAIRELEGVDQAFDPCLDMVITGPYDNDLGGGETFEGEPDTGDTGVAGAAREVNDDGGLTTIGGLAVALGGLILVLLAVLFTRKQREKNSNHLKHQYLDDADMDNDDDDTDVASTNPSPMRGVAYDSNVDIVSDKALGVYEMDESLEVPTNTDRSLEGTVEGGTTTNIASAEDGDTRISSVDPSTGPEPTSRDGESEVSLNDPDEEPSLSSYSWPSAIAGNDRRNPRLAHVVGEDNSIFSSWSFYNDKKKSKGELDRYDLSKDPRSGLARISNETNVHKCSSATCEICEAQRQSGLQFVPVAMPGYSHETLPEESQRLYLAEDTVQL